MWATSILKEAFQGRGYVPVLLSFDLSHLIRIAPKVPAISQWIHPKSPVNNNFLGVN